jgi:hypothetical protein
MHRRATVKISPKSCNKLATVFAGRRFQVTNFIAKAFKCEATNKNNDVLEMQKFR